MTTTDPPVFSKGRDLDAAAAALRPWLAERLGAGGVEVGDFTYPRGAGVSNETILFEARWVGGTEELVLRGAPSPDYQMFMDPAFRMQYDLVAALHQDGTVRVPEVLWFEDDSAVLGQPFFIMRRLHGQVPVSMPVYNSSGWLVEATPAERRVAWHSAMEQLAAIHRLPAEVARLVDRPHLGADGVEQQVEYWTRFASWALGDAIPEVVSTLLEWLAANAPVAPPPALSWGDARVGNMMFGDDFRVVGVMDWEQASLAGPMADLGWWLVFDELHSADAGVARLDGLGTRQETIDLWQELTGCEVTDLLWHEVFAGCKAGLLALRSRSIMNVEAGQRRTSNPFLAKACTRLDLAVPPELA